MEDGNQRDSNQTNYRGKGYRGNRGNYQEQQDRQVYYKKKDYYNQDYKNNQDDSNTQKNDRYNENQNYEKRGGRGGRGRGQNYQNRNEEIKEEKQVQSKLSANDWISMFNGGKPEEQLKKETQQQEENERLKKEKEEAEKKRKDEELAQALIQKQKEEEEAEKQKKEQEEKKQAEEIDKTNEQKEEVKDEQKKKKKSNIVIPPADFDLNNLENLWKDTGKLPKNLSKPQTITYVSTLQKQTSFRNQEYRLQLLEDFWFSMTQLDKVNKGLANSSINCYMNVCLQSLLACPAFFNMCSLVSEQIQPDAAYYQIFKDKILLVKLAEFTRYFDPRVVTLNVDNKFYSKKVIDAQVIFHEERKSFNPDNCQADCSEFLAYFLDKLHQEMKNIYVPTNFDQAFQTISKNTAQKEVINKPQQPEIGNWNEIRSEKNEKIKFVNSDLLQKIEKSLVLDIFGGIIRTEFHVEGSREHTVRFETSFVLSLDIIKDECTIEDCLDRFFEKQRVEGYQLNGKTVRAHHTLMFEKLPNILMVNLKRFVYHDGMIKKKEHVYFDDVLTIEDRHVSPCLQLGIFKRSSEVKARQYRLFSVVEHLGPLATRGHYICYTLDSSNNWVKFDDGKNPTVVDYSEIKNGVQAYLLFYELIMDS